MQIKKVFTYSNLSFSLFLIFSQLLLFTFLFLFFLKLSFFLLVWGYLFLVISLILQFYLIDHYFVKRLTFLSAQIYHKHQALSVVNYNHLKGDAIDVLSVITKAFEMHVLEKENEIAKKLSSLEIDNQRLKQFAYIVSDVMHQIKEGELSVRVSEVISKDEIGNLQVGINTMLEEIQKRTIERNQAEDKLQQYAAALEERNNELKQFSYVASHDLQEPLRKIISFGDCLKDLCEDSLDEQGKDYLARMSGATYRMQKLISSLLSYSRVTSHERTFSTINLSDVVQDVISDLEIMIGSVGAQIEVAALPLVQADMVLMRQLFQNLIANAVKFCQKDKQPQIKIFSKDIDSHYIEISIEDSGIGFDVKYLNKIFQPFQRLHTRDEFEGTGMGLAICSKIVSIHGGSITAESELGLGSVFKIKLAK